MKLKTNLLKAALVVGLGAATATTSMADPDQYIVGTATNTGLTAGNFTLVSEGNSSPVFGYLASLNIAATITTEGELVEKTTGTSGNTTTTEVSKASTARVTNSTILELAGITTKGATLGVALINNEPITVAVVRTRSSVTLTDISDVLQFEDGSIEVTSAENNRYVVRNGGLASTSETSTEWYPTSISIADFMLSGVTTSRVNLNTTPSRESISTSATTSFTGFKEGVEEAPGNITYDEEYIVVGQAFTANPTSTNTTVGQATWSASGLPAGLAINALTGAITGQINSGVENTVYAVEVTATNPLGSTTDTIIFTLVKTLPQI